MKIQFHDLNEERPKEDGYYLTCFTKTFGEEERNYHAVSSHFDNGKFSDYIEEQYKDDVTVYWAEMPTAKELREDW